MVEQELDGTGVLVVGGTDGLDSRNAHGTADLVGKCRGGSLFQQLLMTALQGAIALAQGDAVAVLVGQDLNLDVTGAQNQLLQVHIAVAERGKRLVLSGHELAFEVGGVVHFAHALTAAASGCLDEHRVAHLLGELTSFLDRFDNAVGAGNRGDAARLHGLAGCGLVTHGIDAVGRRADEYQIVVGACAGEIGVLGQEAVTRMDCLAAGIHRCGDDGRHHKIAFISLSRTDAYLFIRVANGIGIGIFR